MNIIFASVVSLFFVSQLYAFPENVRHGYPSCQSCHISPTGGGLTTEYGKRLAEEMMSTWSYENEANVLHNTVKTPDWLNFGGDIRTLAFYRDAKIYKEKRYMLMQADVTVGMSFKDFTLVLGAGVYDKDPQSQVMYLKYQPSEHWSLRLGKFYVPFGVQTPDHYTVTRAGMGFNEGEQTIGLEFGYYQPNFEWLIAPFIGSGGEAIMEKESGLASKFGYFVGKRSVIGLSTIWGEGPVYERAAYGPYLMTGLTEKIVLISELYFQDQRAKEDSVKTRSGAFNYNKLSYEVIKGLLPFTTVEFSRRDYRRERTISNALGAGVQWFPRPHFEISGSWQRRDDRYLSDKWGDLGSMMLHYYF